MDTGFPKGRDVLAIKRVVSIPETGRITVGVVVESPGHQGDKPTATEKKRYDVVDEAGRRIKPREGGNTLKITSVSPAPGSVLRVGENVDFDAGIDYELRSRNSGRIVWFLVTGGEVQTFLSSQVVSKGKGTLRLNKSVQIHPGLGAEPRMFVYLMAEVQVQSEYSKHVQSENDHDDPCNLLQYPALGQQDLAYSGRRGARSDKTDRESDDKHQ